jgi:hypothetical protein
MQTNWVEILILFIDKATRRDIRKANNVTHVGSYKCSTKFLFSYLLT